MIAFSMETTVLAGAVVLAVGTVLGAVVGWWYRGHRDAPEEFDAALAEIDGAGHQAVLDAPDMAAGLWGLFKHIRHRRKAKKLAKRGYVKWYLLDGMLKHPQWVKPERQGAGVPEYHVRSHGSDGITYFFPTDALATDAETGAPVAVHHKGEVEPVNLPSPETPPIDGDRLQETINLEAESDPPGLLDNIDLTPQTLMWVMIVGVLAIGAAQQFLT